MKPFTNFKKTTEQLGGHFHGTGASKETKLTIMCNISTSTGDAVSRSSAVYELSGVYTNGMVVIPLADWQ